MQPYDYLGFINNQSEFSYQVRSGGQIGRLWTPPSVGCNLFLAKKYTLSTETTARRASLEDLCKSWHNAKIIAKPFRLAMMEGFPGMS